MNKYIDFIHEAASQAEDGDGYMIVEIRKGKFACFWADTNDTIDIGDTYFAIPFPEGAYTAFVDMIGDKYKVKGAGLFAFKYKGKLLDALEEAADFYCCCTDCEAIDNMTYEESVAVATRINAMMTGADW